MVVLGFAPPRMEARPRTAGISARGNTTVSGTPAVSPGADDARDPARGEVRRIRWNRWTGWALSVLAFLSFSGSAVAETVDKNDLGSMYRVREAIKAGEMWRDHWTGDGVDVALIDTGVVPVDGLSAPGK